jgi:hypothetical protein
MEEMARVYFHFLVIPGPSKGIETNVTAPSGGEDGAAGMSARNVGISVLWRSLP